MPAAIPHCHRFWPFLPTEKNVAFVCVALWGRVRVHVSVLWEAAGVWFSGSRIRHRLSLRKVVAGLARHVA